MKSGGWWVLGMLALGSAAGMFAVTYWKRPDSSVRWSFTQIHTSLVRGRKEAAARFYAPRVIWDGKEMSDAEFSAAYTQPPEAAPIETQPCPSAPSHWIVTMKTNVFCFYEDGSIWRLHEVGTAACRCKP